MLYCTICFRRLKPCFDWGLCCACRKRPKGTTRLNPNPRSLPELRTRCLVLAIIDDSMKSVGRLPLLHLSRVCDHSHYPFFAYLRATGIDIRSNGRTIDIYQFTFGPRQANLVLIAYASSEGSGEPAHPRSLARTSAARSYKQWVKRNLQTESQIPGPSEWLGMRS